MSSRIFARNAFETALDGGINATQTTITLDSATGLSFPGILVINDDDPSLREYVEYTGISTNDLTGCTRGGAGSAGGTAHIHSTGARVRSVYVHQIQDRLWDDVEALETADTDHVAAGDPHVGYVQAGGDTMSGLLTLSGPPTIGLHAATKDYSDLKLPLAGGIMSGDIGLAGFKVVNSGTPSDPLDLATKQYVDGALGAPSGSRMIFDQAVAPIGWTRDTSTVDDRVIRIVTGGLADGGTWSQPVHNHNGPSHTHTNPSVTAEPGHDHTGGDHSHTNPQTGNGSNATAIATENGGSTFEYNIKSHSHSQGTTGTSGAGTTGSAGAHGHPQGPTGGAGTGVTSGNATASSWRPLHRDMIICSKD